MKRKHLFLLMALLLAAGALWFARSTGRTRAIDQASTDVRFNTPHHSNSAPSSSVSLARDSRTDPSLGSNNFPRRVHRPPVPNKRFTDFTPEERVEFARKGRGPGG